MVWSGALRGYEHFYHNMALLVSTRACLVVVAMLLPLGSE